MARRAELWLLDEPHAGLDAAGRDELDGVLRQAVGAGATVLVASHELERAGSLADRVVDVVGGQVSTPTRARTRLGELAVSRWRIARLIAAKDLRIERRSGVVLNQVLPFAGVTMVMFAFALDAKGVRVDGDRVVGVLELVAPGLIWLATLFSLLVLVQRSFAVEGDDGALDALRVAGVDPVAIFWGKSIALAVQLAVLEVVLLVIAAVLLYGADGAARRRSCCSSQP